jgi:probable addiction module antidote protein
MCSGGSRDWGNPLNRSLSDSQCTCRRRIAPSSRRRVSVIPMSSNVEKSLRAAFATNDLRRICSAIDFAVTRCGVVEVARHADVNRTTLYRAFRCRNGPALDTMLKVVRVLEFHLTVEAGRISVFPAVNCLSQRAPSPQATATAHSLTAALRSCDPTATIEALGETLRAQENVSELARKTIRWRETLYRTFSYPNVPRFSTVLSFLDALGLQFSIERRSENFGTAVTLLHKKISRPA